MHQNISDEPTFYRIQPNTVRKCDIVIDLTMRYLDDCLVFSNSQRERQVEWVTHKVN